MVADVRADLDATDPWSSLLKSHRANRDPHRLHTPAHAPTAAILTCSDARVPPSLIFAQQAGRLFTIRVAGNTACPAALASIDYAIDLLGVRLVVVLGHTNCGAIAAAKAGFCDGYLGPLTHQICDLYHEDPEQDCQTLAQRNVLATVDALTASDSPTGRTIRSGQAAIHGAIYDLATDTVHDLATTAPPTDSPTATT